MPENENQDREYTFHLTLAEANVVIASLGKMPYESVFNVIDKFRLQFGQQVQTEQAQNDLLTEQDGTPFAMND